MPASTTPTNLSPAELSYLYTSLTLSPPIRPDARSPRTFRPLRAETDILPACNGSSHVSLADGSEAIVGIKAEVARTPNPRRPTQPANDDVMAIDSLPPPPSNPAWLTLSIDISTLRDDDPLLTSLNAMLTEPCTPPPPSLAALPINHAWHWHLYIDIVLLSFITNSRAAIAPLPLLSLAVHLALQTTRLPHLISQGEEDPLVDDDWANSIPIFPTLNAKGKDKAKARSTAQTTREPSAPAPPLTLLVMTAGPTLLFDPTPAELAVADAIFAVSIAESGPDGRLGLLALRTLDPPARDTMPGVPSAAVQARYGPGEAVPGCWVPRVGGTKREVVKRVVREVLGENEKGVGREVLEGLKGFLKVDTG